MLDKGLLQLLDVIANNPHDPVLARRFMALVSELDQNTKEEATLRLADIQIESFPIESLRLAKLVYNENPRNVSSLEIVQKCMRTLGKFAKAEIIGIEIEKIKTGKGPTTLEARREQVEMIEKLTSTNLNPRQAMEELRSDPAPPPAAQTPEKKKQSQPVPVQAEAPPPPVKAVPPPPPAVNLDDQDFEKDDDDIFSGDGSDLDTEFMGNMDDGEEQVSNEMTFQPPNLDDDTDYDLSFDEIPVSPGRREPLINTSSPPNNTSIALDETEVVPPAPQKAAPVQQAHRNREQVQPPAPVPPMQNISHNAAPAAAPKSPEPPQAVPPVQAANASQWQQPRSQPAEQSKSWLNVLSKIRSRKPAVDPDTEKKVIQAPKSIPSNSKPEMAKVPASMPPPPLSSAAISSASNPNLAAGIARKLPPGSRQLFSGEFLYEIFQINRGLDVEALRSKALAAAKPQPAPNFESDVLKAFMAKMETISEEHIRWELLAGIWCGQANSDTLAVIKKFKLSHKSCGMWGLYLDSLLAGGDGRKALYDIYKTLKANHSLAWAQVAWARLPAVWDRLKVWGHTWQPEEGVPKLIELIERRRPPKFSAFAAQERPSHLPMAKSA